MQPFVSVHTSAKHQSIPCYWTYTTRHCGIRTYPSGRTPFGNKRIKTKNYASADKFTEENNNIFWLMTQTLTFSMFWKLWLKHFDGHFVASCSEVAVYCDLTPTAPCRADSTVISFKFKSFPDVIPRAKKHHMLELRYLL